MQDVVASNTHVVAPLDGNQTSIAGVRSQTNDRNSTD